MQIIFLVCLFVFLLGLFFFILSILGCAGSLLLQEPLQWASRRCGLSHGRARAPGHVAFPCCGPWALETELSSRGAQTYLPLGQWGLPGSGVTPVRLASAGSLPLSHQGSPIFFFFFFCQALHVFFITVFILFCYFNFYVSDLLVFFPILSHREIFPKSPVVQVIHPCFLQILL